MATATIVDVEWTHDTEGKSTPLKGHWQVQGSGKNPYDIKLIGGVWSCSCPAWRNQSKPIDERMCKHTAQVIAMSTGKTVTVTPTQKSATTTSEELLKAAVAARVQLAHPYDGRDIIGWHMSEKLDGVRAWWNGKQFLSRNGNVFQAPDWFVEGLPNVPLDGELWAGRGQFQKAVSIARQANAGDQWKEMFFMIFDAPENEQPFAHRYAYLHDLGKANKCAPMSGVQRLAPKGFILPQTLITDMGTVRQEMDAVRKKGGEGLMFRHPTNPYTGGRSYDLMKMKEMLDDVAVVIDMVEGEGRHKGTMGALVCRNKRGEFKVGTGFSDAARRDWWSHRGSISAGYVIEYAYQELTNDGNPRFPAMIRVRRDLTKADVL